jgi:hypothetical protein
MAWMDITSELTPQGIERLEVGQILRFDQGGDLYELKIMRKSGGKVWAKPVLTYDPKEINIKDK